MGGQAQPEIIVLGKVTRAPATDAIEGVSPQGDRRVKERALDQQGRVKAGQGIDPLDIAAHSAAERSDQDGLPAHRRQLRVRREGLSLSVQATWKGNIIRIEAGNERPLRNGAPVLQCGCLLYTSPSPRD